MSITITNVEKLMKYTLSKQCERCEPGMMFHELAYKMLCDNIFDDHESMKYLLVESMKIHCEVDCDCTENSYKVFLFFKAIELCEYDLMKHIYMKFKPMLTPGDFEGIWSDIFMISDTEKLLDIIKWLIARLSVNNSIDIMAIGRQAFRQACMTSNHSLSILRRLFDEGYMVPVKEEHTVLETVGYLRSQHLLIGSVYCDACSCKISDKKPVITPDSKQEPKFVVCSSSARSNFDRWCEYSLTSTSRTCDRAVSNGTIYCPAHYRGYKQRSRVTVKVVNGPIKIRTCFDGYSVELPGILGEVMVNVDFPVKENIVVTALGRTNLRTTDIKELTEKEKMIAREAGLIVK